MTGSSEGLIARLEATECGGRELDVALAWNRWVEPKLWARTTHSGKTVWTVERDGKRMALPAYTTSLDAALSLAERVLPGCEVRIIKDTSGPGWASIGIVEAVAGRASSPALALCAAILRAQSAVDRGGRP